MKGLLTADRPVVVADGSDSTQAGAPGDSTIILKALLEMDISRPVFLPIIDPEGVARAAEVGIDREVTLMVGESMTIFLANQCPCVLWLETLLRQRRY